MAGALNSRGLSPADSVVAQRLSLGHWVGGDRLQPTSRSPAVHTMSATANTSELGDSTSSFFFCSFPRRRCLESRVRGKLSKRFQHPDDDTGLRGVAPDTKDQFVPQTFIIEDSLEANSA